MKHCSLILFIQKNNHRIHFDWRCWWNNQNTHTQTHASRPQNVNQPENCAQRVHLYIYWHIASNMAQCNHVSTSIYPRVCFIVYVVCSFLVHMRRLPSHHHYDEMFIVCVDFHIIQFFLSLTVSLALFLGVVVWRNNFAFETCNL